MEKQKPCHAARDCAIPPRPEETGFPAQMMKTKTCPHCDLLVAADALFCPRCMVQLREPRLNLIGRLMPWVLGITFVLAMILTVNQVLELKDLWSDGAVSAFQFLKLLAPGAAFIGFWLLSIPLMSFVRTK